MYGVQSSLRSTSVNPAGSARLASIQRSLPSTIAIARCAGGRSSRGFSASASLTVRAGGRASAAGAPGVPEAAAAPVAAFA